MTKSNLGSAKLLVVDDYDDARSMLRSILELQNQYQVIGAQDGNEAIERAALEMPDLILMDIAMPGMDGLEATRRIKQNPQTAHIPVIAVSVLCTHKEGRQRTLDAGCIACIEKPFNPDVLLMVIRQHLGEAD